MTEDQVPVAVIGTGNMGSNHARVYDSMSGADLVEIVEPDTDNAADIAEAYDVVVHEEVSTLSRAEAVSIAVPNQFHLEVATRCAEMGLDLLVEKPLATTVDAANEIRRTAKKNNVILQVGHIERFNPAVIALGEILQEEEIIALEAHRLGPFTDHLVEENVIFDLMLHDIDIISSLVPSNVDYVDAIGAEARSDILDHAVAHLKFENGVLGTTTASQVTHGKIRTLDVTTQGMYMSLDYQDQDIVIQRRGTEETVALNQHSGYRTEVVTEKPFVGTREPLKVELEHFLSCVKDRSSPRVGGREGVAAVELAVELSEMVGSH